MKVKLFTVKALLKIVFALSCSFVLSSYNISLSLLTNTILINAMSSKMSKCVYRTGLILSTTGNWMPGYLNVKNLKVHKIRSSFLNLKISDIQIKIWISNSPTLTEFVTLIKFQTNSPN